MICTSVIPVAWPKITKLCPIFLSYFPGFFGHFESLAFFKKNWGGGGGEGRQT